MRYSLVKAKGAGGRRWRALSAEVVNGKRYKPAESDMAMLSDLTAIRLEGTGIFTITTCLFIKPGALYLCIGILVDAIASAVRSLIQGGPVRQ